MESFIPAVSNSIKLYHYTSIETLALILANKRIRFNRLDQVDDAEESIYSSGEWNTQLGQYTFASCWTDLEEENPALWKMYTNNFRGVRIGIKSKHIFDIKEVDDKVFCIGDSNEKVGEDFKIRHLDYLETFFKIKYKKAEELKEIIKNAISRPSNPEAKGWGLSTFQIGRYKREIWGFQSEWRFKIFVHPIDNNGDYTSMYVNNTPISINNIDVKLSDNFVDNFEIVLGPLCNDADRYIVESICENYCCENFPKERIVNSCLTGLSRK